jgi:hypothetical protein
VPGHCIDCLSLCLLRHCTPATVVEMMPAVQLTGGSKGLRSPSVLGKLFSFFRCGLFPRIRDLRRHSTFLEADAYLSDPLPPQAVQNHGSFTIFPVRRPHDLTPFEKARDEIRRLWEEYMQDGLIKTNMCTECPVVGDYLGIAYPGTKLERVKAFTWLYTIFFLLDGTSKSR